MMIGWLIKFCLLLTLMVNVAYVAQAQEFDPFSYDPKQQQEAAQASVNKYGETPSSHEQALEYYDHCMEKRNGYMCKAAQDNFCACAALRIREEMSMGDMATFDRDVSSRDSATLIFVQRVVGPCMFQPVYEDTFDKCLERKDLAKSYAATQIRICKCAGASMKNFVERDLGGYTSHMMASDFDGRSAYARFFGSVKYDQMVRRYTDQCAMQIGK